MNPDKSLKWLAAAHVGLAFVIILFWLGFHGEIIFSRVVLAPRIANFEGYYGWERAFTIPDLLLALTMISGGVRLWRNPDDLGGIVLLLAASGACVFLGVLDFAYDSTHGLYFLDHIFSLALLSIAVVMPPFGIISLVVLSRALRRLITQP